MPRGENSSPRSKNSSPRSENSSPSSENSIPQKCCQANTKTYQHDSSRSLEENVRIIEITNSQNQQRNQKMINPQWSSKVLINCEKQEERATKYAREEYEQGKGCISLENKDLRLPERSGVKHIHSIFVKRSKSEITPDREKVEVLQLKKHCKSLVTELENVKSEIVKILTEK